MIGIAGVHDRDRRRQIEHLPALLHGLARDMRAGRTLNHAVRRAAGDTDVAGPALRAAVARIDRGVGVVESIDRWAADLTHPDADLVRAVLNTGTTTGASMAASLDRAAGSLQERADLRREVRALSSQARASALVLTLAPVAFLLVMGAADPSLIDGVMGSAVGRGAFTLGLVLDGAGWVWMRRMTAEVSR